MLGYRQDREDWDYLRAHSVEFPASVCASSDIPEEFHPKLRTKMQSRTNACVGFGRSTMFAALQLLLTGEEVNYSAWYAYLAAQEASGMSGTDDGATLAGAMASGGCCRDELLPFPGYYLNNMTRAAKDEAAQHKILQYSQLRGYDEIWRFTSSHQGPVLFGAEWFEGQDAIGAEGIESKATALRGAKRGYHCRCFIGWSKRRDSQGRHYLWAKNSHSEKWGNHGESEVEPALIDEWTNDRFSAFFGASEVRPYAPRPVQWSQHKWIS